MSARPHILLVDDDETWLESLAEYLRDKGFAVATATDGGRALALLEEVSPGLAVVDVNMPAMDGFEFLRRARRRRDLAVLFVSGDEEPSVAERARAEGAWGFLAKTASLALLLRTVRQALKTAADQPFLTRWDRLLPGPRRAGIPSV